MVKYAKKKEAEVAAVYLQLLGGLTVPSNTDHIVSRPPHLTSTFPYQKHFLYHQASMRMKKKSLEENAVLPYTETNKLAHPLIFN